VIKLDIINRIAERTGVPKLKAEQAVDALFHSMKESLARGDRIELRGFGVFIVKPRKRGIGRNPRTGEEVAIPSGKTIRFKPGKECRPARKPSFRARSAGARPVVKFEARISESAVIAGSRILASCLIDSCPS